MFVNTYAPFSNMNIGLTLNFKITRDDQGQSTYQIWSFLGKAFLS